MADHDDLEFNPFYKCLQSNFRDAFENAQENCYLVCIPQSASLVGVSISQVFVETHLLKPSPMLQDHYISTDKDGTKTIILDEDIIMTTEGFRNPGRVRVMSEELGYNKLYKPFKMLIIERPLEGAVKGQRGSAGLSDGFLTPRIGYLENKKFLNLFPENRQHIASLDETIRQFNKTYMMVKGYLDAAAGKLRQMWEVSSEAIVDSNNYVKLQSDSRLEEAISLAVESYIMGGVHSKVINAVTTHFCKLDKHLSQKVEELQWVTGEQLALREEFCCPVPAAVVELARLDGINNPHEKLLCLKSTLDSITKDVNAHLKCRQAVPGFDTGASTSVLTSDELIPLLVMVISHAKCSHLASNLYYMEKFHWVASKHDDMGYTLVTFKAAMEYMRNTDFSHIKTSTNKLKKEMSIEELMAASQQVYSDGNGSPGEERRRTKHPSGHADTSLHMKLENITRMMESSTSPVASSMVRPIFSGFEENLERQNRGRAAPPPDVIPIRDQRSSSKTAQLGDFLSALQNDVFDGTYGKQE